MAVYQDPDSPVDSVQISEALTWCSEVSFLVLVQIPGFPDPVSALIDSSATSNFLDSSLADSPLFVTEPLDLPITLCLFDGKPVTAGFIHESVTTSVAFTDGSTQNVSLLVTKLHPSAPMVFGLPWLRSTNPMTGCSTLSLTFKTGPQSVLPLLALARACSTAALCHEDIISNLSPVFDSIPELCTSSGPSLPTKVVASAQKMPSVKLGPFSSNSAPPLGSIPWDRHRFAPPALHAWDPSSSWFSASDTFKPLAGGVISPATVLPLSWDDHVNNHLFVGDHPPTTVNTPLCQVEAIPHKSEGIEPLTTVNSPPCQVGVTPRKSEGIEPFNMVNTPPCQVEVLPSHPINTPSGHLEDTSSPLFPTSVPIAPHVLLVKSPSSSCPATDPIAPVVLSVMSPLCHTPPDTTRPPLKTTQATSHEQPVDTPIRSELPQSAFIEEV